MLSTLTECGIPMTSLWNQYDGIVATVTDIWRHWYRSMAGSVCHAPSIFNDISIWNSFNSYFKFSQMIILKSFISVLWVPPFTCRFVRIAYWSAQVSFVLKQAHSWMVWFFLNCCISFSIFILPPKLFICFCNGGLEHCLWNNADFTGNWFT